MRPLWSKELQLTSSTADAEVNLRISSNGILRLVATKDKREVVVWSSNESCPDSGGAAMRLDRDSGVPKIYCGNGHVISL